MAVGGASTSAGTTTTKTTLSESKQQHYHYLYRRLPPPLWRSFSTATTPLDDIPVLYDDDCPLCAKYGSGPCGGLFRHWWTCTETAKEGGAEETDVASQCAAEFERLQKCLDDHSDHYDAILVVDNEQQDEQEERDNTVQDAWETMIRDELSNAPREEFPSHLQAPLRNRIKTGQATVSLVAEHLVLAFVQQTNLSDGSKTLLAAGAKQDFYVDPCDKERITVPFAVSATLSPIVVSAVYEVQDDNVVVYERHINSLYLQKDEPHDD